MIKFIIILLFFNFNIVAYSQVIKGIVLERKTNNPVLATIYFSGTFVGTLSDLNGNFELDISKNNSIPLTISSIGYYSITLTDYSKVKPLIIYLTPKVHELKEVVISSKSIARKRIAYLNKFKDVFLGTTDNARNCEIINENDITFNYDSCRDTLKAFASKPILINNKALGYKISYYLDKFEYNARRPVKENADGHFRSYGVPDYSLTVTDRMSGSHDPIQVLQGRTEGLFITGDSHQGYQFIFHGQKVPKGESPLFLLDDKEVDLSTICNLPIEVVDKIEYIKESGALAFYGFRGSFGVISVLTKRGINGSIPPVLNFITRRIYGYYQARTFYTPNYNISQSEYNKPDLRTTIYWDPNVVTDKDGNATISFFNADSKAIIKVDVEGIVEPGIPLVGRSSFESK